jgi:hypothetical protein
MRASERDWLELLFPSPCRLFLWIQSTYSASKDGILPTLWRGVCSMAGSNTNMCPFKKKHDANPLTKTRVNLNSAYFGRHLGLILLRRFIFACLNMLIGTEHCVFNFRYTIIGLYLVKIRQTS